MNPRTQWLAAGGFAVLLFYLGDTSYRNFIEQPTEEYTRQIAELEDQIQSADGEQRMAAKKRKAMSALSSRALPSDPELARSSYQAWLLQLLEKYRMQSAAVDAGNPIPMEIRSRSDRKKRRTVGHQLAVSVRCTATLDQLTDFLYEFEQSAHLHKVLSLSLSPLGNGAEMNIAMNLEALSLKNADREQQLSDWVRDPNSIVDREHYAPLVRRNLFARGFSKTLAQIRLHAITFDREGAAEAGLASKPNESPHILKIGDSVPVPLHDVRVLAVELEKAKLWVNDSECWVSIGQTLGEVCNPEQDDHD